MGIEALTTTDAEVVVTSSTAQEWLDWVSATDTRNFLLKDPLLDWLDLYGEQNGFVRDTELPVYDPRTDFTRFLFEKTKEFEAAVTEYLRTITTVRTIASNPGDARRIEMAQETFAAMKRGVPLIYQGVLWDAENRTYGVPDFLLRSDELARLFPSALSREEAALPANNLDRARWHYRVVDLKFTTLDLLAGGELDNSGSAPAYKAQLFIYNRALGRVQGYLPPVSYLMGRGWRQTRQSVTRRGDGAMDFLAPVLRDSTLQKGMSLDLAVSRACEWIRRLRTDGQKWSALPDPTVPELRPNMGNREDAPWSDAKKQIAEKLEELTLLWYVGVEKRQDANNLGIFRWRDPKCTASSVGVTG